MKKSIWLLILSGILGAALAGAPPTISLLSPQGGENWVLGSQHPIVWTTIKGLAGPLYINLWGYNRSGQLIPLGQIAEVEYGKGSYLWKTGELLDRKVGVGRYHVRIKARCVGQPLMESWDPVAFRLIAFALPKPVAVR
jgi:hypothetical protein